MASNGSSDRTSSGQRSFGFGSDDVLCAYDEFTNQDQSTGIGRRSDPSIQEFHESRAGRPLVSVYGHQDEYPKEEIITVVEKCMKKYADNLMRHLEGISGRLSQLEVYCFKLERSVGEFRADMIRDQSGTDTKLNSLEKHLQEVHRSIQILRDKQELAETQKELTKLQLSPPKDSSIDTQSQRIKDSESTIFEQKQEISNPQSALALPHQLPMSQPQVPPPPPPHHPALPSQSSGPHDHYYSNQAVQFYPQHEPPQHIQPKPQIQDSIQSPLQQQPQQYPHYQQQQQQWTHPSSQQFTPQAMAPSQQPTPQPQPQPPVRPHASFGYSQIPQPNAQQSSFGARPVKPSGYASGSRPPYPPHYNTQAYNYSDGSRGQSYPPSSYPQAPSNSSSGYHQQMMQGHPYADMIDKAVSMGYPSGQVIGVVNMMADSGQLVDFNALLDRLNSGGAPRPWSG